MERRRSPIPPPREMRYTDRREDRRPPPPRDPHDFRDSRRRMRSVSPDRPYRRSPVKRYRRDDEYYDRYDRGGSPPYRRSPPYRERYEAKGHYREEPRDASRGGEEYGKPWTFKEFITRVDDDVSPEEAQQRYQDYLTEYYGNAIKGEFERRKNDQATRALYDIRSLEKALARRYEECKEGAAEFFAELASNKIDPTAPDFNQGSVESAKGSQEGTDASVAEAPAVCWRAPRVAADLELSGRLIRVLDAEKGIEENPIAPKLEQPEDKEDKEEAAAVEPPEQVVDESNLADSLGRLDVQLTYLWKVHGVDYYGGVELGADDFGKRLSTARKLRGPCPEEGEEGDAEEDAKSLAALKEAVDNVWAARCESGDPLEKKCMRSEVEARLEQWIEEQLVQHAEKKWGSKLSEKLFMGKQFVVKHIKLKHQAVLAAQKEKVLDELYFEAFKAAKEKEEEARAAAAAAALRPPEFAGAPDAPEHVLNGGGGYQFEEAEGEEFGDGAPLPVRGRGGVRVRGRRLMGGRMRRLDAQPIVGGLPGMGPIFVPAPGAGPMGPFIVAPMGSMGGPVPMDMEPVMPPRRGLPRAMRGRGRLPGAMPGMMPGPIILGGPGAKLDPRGVREYYDLDAPRNNRAVLDYGDL